MDKFSLYNLLLALKDGLISERELNKLYIHCLDVSKNYLRIKYSESIRDYDRYNTTITDLAVEAIEPLFTKTSAESFGILSSLKNFSKDITNNSEATFFINRVVWRRSDQAFFSLLKKNDPFFEKIHRTLSTCISNNQYKKVSYFGTIYIVNQDIEEITGYVIPYEEFLQLPIKLFLAKQSNLLNGILTHLNNDTEYFPAIPYNCLIKKIKEINLQEYIGDRPSDRLIDKTEIDEIINKSVLFVQEKLQKIYVETSKIDKETGTILIDSFKLIGEDLKNGGMYGTLFDYISTENNALTKSEFYKNYHGIMNYLFNQFRNHIRDKIYE